MERPLVQANTRIFLFKYFLNLILCSTTTSETRGKKFCRKTINTSPTRISFGLNVNNTSLVRGSVVLNIFLL